MHSCIHRWCTLTNRRGRDAIKVIVTAGGSGLGAVIAESFLRQGAQVSTCDIDTGAVERCRVQHPTLLIETIDVRDAEALRNWTDRSITALGGCDVLINNAGVAGPVGLVEDIDLDGWRDCLQVNLDAQLITSQATIPTMKAQKSGVILNMSSTSGLYGTPNRAAYTASKWAVIGFTKTLAIELGPFGIRCNAICPTSVEGERIDRVLAAQAEVTGSTVDAVRDDYTAGTSLRRFARASEIADMCWFLASDSAAFVSGQAIAVDGNTETYRLE